MWRSRDAPRVRLRPQLIRQFRDGVVDLVWTVNGYTSELFPPTEVFELPGVYKGDTAATDLAMRELYNEYLAPEYDGLRVIVLHVHGTLFLPRLLS